LDVYAGTDVKIVFLVNNVRFDLRQTTSIAISAFDAWAIRVVGTSLPAEVAAGPTISSYLMKAQPTVIP
jgi:hypothetical protein